MITLKWLPVKTMRAPKHHMTILKCIVDVKTRNPFDIHVGRNGCVVWPFAREHIVFCSNQRQ